MTLSQRERRVRSSNPVHNGRHDGRHCTRCKAAVLHLRSKLGGMTFRERKLVLQELVADGTAENLDGMRISAKDLKALLPHFYAGIELPQGFDRKKMGVEDFLRNSGALYDAMRPSSRQPRAVKSSRKRGRYDAARQLEQQVRNAHPNYRLTA